MEQKQGRRLVLFPLPLQGHINPMLELANILHSRGFYITVIHTNFNSPNPSNYPNFTFHSFPDGLSQTEASTNDIPSLLLHLNTKCVQPFKECLATLISVASEEPYTCLISDGLFHFTQAVADSFKLPRVVLRTAGASSFAVFTAFPLLLEKDYFPIQDSRLEEAVIELPFLKVKDLPTMSTRNPEKFFELLTTMISATKASSGIIWNTFEDLEQPALDLLKKQLCVPLFSIGPFHKYNSAISSGSLLTEDKSSISWLDTQPPKSVVYVSFGSIAATSEAEFLEIAWGLANSEQPFLWVVRPWSVSGAEWLELLPKGFIENLGGRGHIVKWAPQKEVLAHVSVGAFWTHNGWNSTLESICEGVPMICMPCFSDQKVNAVYVSRVWKVGFQLENGKLERGEIEQNIRKLMKAKEGEEIRCRASKLKEKSLSCLKQGGSSYQSLDSLVSHILSLESFSFPAKS
ncbi:UDP-glycosyltransferase 76F1-like [Humulus lupulus]|uniref:UDP-glycosyltransferase 76F1-like n=1 Tax=Humulus lupulus TaxID=3486 RepID=UPI002B4180E3|nr:UDP-glycosyltransferase 76F1-like [Humulus lupulus]